MTPRLLHRLPRDEQGRPYTDLELDGRVIRTTWIQLPSGGYATRVTVR